MIFPEFEIFVALAVAMILKDSFYPMWWGQGAPDLESPDSVNGSRLNGWVSGPLDEGGA